MPQEPNFTPEVCQFVGVFEVACQECDKQRFCLPQGARLSAAFRYTCKDCCGTQSVVDTPTSEIENQEKGKETSRRWRANHKAEAAESTRRRHAGVSYVESRRELMSDAAWDAKLKEFAYVCSTPGCGRPVTLKTAFRSADGPTYRPICAGCLGKKAAKERWEKEKRAL